MEDSDSGRRVWSSFQKLRWNFLSLSLFLSLWNILEEFTLSWKKDAEPFGLNLISTKTFQFFIPENSKGSNISFLRPLGMGWGERIDVIVLLSHVYHSLIDWKGHKGERWAPEISLTSRVKVGTRRREKRGESFFLSFFLCFFIF